MNNKLAFTDVLASIYYYINTFSSISRKEIIDSFNVDLKFWVDNGIFTSNQNRSKMVYDLCKKYKLPNKDFNYINSLFYDLKRSKKEINEFYYLL